MSLSSIILAAGKGTRMRSDSLSKVMHQVAGRPIISWILDAVLPFGGAHLVVGHLREQVESFVRSRYPGVRFSVQVTQDGTGGAVRCAFADADPAADRFLILPGDAPLLKKETLERLIATFEDGRPALAFLTCLLDDPAQYGRVRRSPGGGVTGIVEYRDATEEERALKEVNSGIYLVSRSLLAAFLPRMTTDNRKGEYYLTDIIAFAVSNGYAVTALVEDDAASLAGINSPEELAQADAVMRERLARSVS